MAPIKTQRKKRSINLDKIAENIEIDKYDISEFNKVLNKYSIPSFSEENNVINILRDLKTKTQKRQKTHKPSIKKEEITNFFKEKEIQRENEQRKEKELKEKQKHLVSKTQKRVQFISAPKTLDNLIERVKEKKENIPQLKHHNQKKSPTRSDVPRIEIKYNPRIDPYFDPIQELRYKLMTPQTQTQTQNQNQTQTQTKNTEKEQKEIKSIKLDGIYIEDDEEEKEKIKKELEMKKEYERMKKELEKKELEKKELEKKELEKKELERRKPKSKEDLYQEALAYQIGIIESKINEYEYLLQYRPKNHPSLIQLKIDIIKEKKKLKELLPDTTQKKENENNNPVNDNFNIFEIKNYKKEAGEEQEQEQFKNLKKPEIRKEPIKIKIKEQVKQQQHQPEINYNYSYNVNENRKDLNLKKKEKVEDIFKYDKKIVEREFQTKYQKLQQQPQKPSPKPKPVLQQKPQINTNRRNQDDIKIVNLDYPIDEDEIVTPEKKVIVNENSNLTCEILIPQQEPEEFREKYQHQQTPKRSKTMINHNRLRKKPFRRDENNEYYCSDKEKSPAQWNTINCDVNVDSLPLHLRVKPMKMTQKKVRDFLIKEKITNPNKNLPEDLANFLYSSITSNDYQVNFVDIVDIVNE
jgi:hypothetical protein